MEPQETSVASAMPLPAAPGPAPLSGTGNPVPSPVAGSSVNAPLQADDAEIIEPAWVAAVQHIMNRYRHDPFALSQAMSALRQDYLLKRYNKRVGPVE